jgi:ligand-binding sensor domain-containing protein
LGVAAAGSPLPPVLTAKTNDWSISLNYTSGGGLSVGSTVGSFAIDSIGNLWITDTKAGSVVEWNAMGAALSPSTGFPGGGGPIAIDATGNVWISGDGSLNELTSLGSPFPWSPFGGVPGGGGDIAFDAQSNLWITNSGGVNEFSNLGLQLSPVSGYTVDGLTSIATLAIDSSNNVWLGTLPTSQNSSGQVAELSNPGGQPITTGGPGVTVPQMAADSAGDIWYVGAQICEAPPYGGKGSTLVSNCTQVGVSDASTNRLQLLNPAGIAIDGVGTVWVASPGGQQVVPPGVLPIVPGSDAATDATPYSSPSLAAGPLRVAIDGSGNIWVLLANNTVTEYVGAATPAVTPLALGIKDKKFGARP